MYKSTSSIVIVHDHVLIKIYLSDYLRYIKDSHFNQYSVLPEMKNLEEICRITCSFITM